jgi:hypothetical protein
VPAACKPSTGHWSVSFTQPISGWTTCNTYCPTKGAVVGTGTALTVCCQ